LSIWTELRDGIRLAISVQERVERLTADVERINDRQFGFDRRLVSIETIVEVARRNLPR